MKAQRTTLPGIYLLESPVFHDGRGWFAESFREDHFAQALQAQGEAAPPHLLQDNLSCSSAGVLRGLHYQAAPHGQAKLVRVLQGRVWDVAVDLRPASRHFGQLWAGELSAAQGQSLWLPAGFAHGFLALEDNTLLSYKASAYFRPESERCIRWDDPTLAINWPLQAWPQGPLVSSKDRNGGPMVVP